MKEEMNLSDLWGGCIWSSSKPQTNADRIRRMSDEELARLFDDILKYNVVGEPDENVCSDCYKTDCAPCWLDWLKAEVDE